MPEKICKIIYMYCIFSLQCIARTVCFYFFAIYKGTKTQYTNPHANVLLFLQLHRRVEIC